MYRGDSSAIEAAASETRMNTHMNPYDRERFIIHLALYAICVFRYESRYDPPLATLTRDSQRDHSLLYYYYLWLKFIGSYVFRILLDLNVTKNIFFL